MAWLALGSRYLAYVAAFGVVLAGSAVAAGQSGFLSGTAPADLGVKDGRLKEPSLTPNSVLSQTAGLYPTHPQAAYAAIEPLAFTGDPAAAWTRLTELVKATPGCTVETVQADYLYATCTTRLLKFTDDVEFYMLPADQLIHVRSASRIGRRDFGVNRARVEVWRARFAMPAP